MKFLLSIILIAGSGFVAGINLTSLYPSPEHTGSWWSIGLAIVVLVFQTIVLYANHTGD